MPPRTPCATWRCRISRSCSRAWPRRSATSRRRIQPDAAARTRLGRRLGWQRRGRRPALRRASPRRADGIDTGDRAWGLVTPCTGRSARPYHACSTRPQLEARRGRVARPVRGGARLFESEGFRLLWGAPLAGTRRMTTSTRLPSASLDRVIGRNVDPWLRHASEGALHPPAAERGADAAVQPSAERGARGTRRAGAELVLAQRLRRASAGARAGRGAGRRTLRAPLLADDWAAWAEAWRALDAGPSARAAAAAPAERHPDACAANAGAHRFDRAAGLWQRVAALARPASRTPCWRPVSTALRRSRCATCRRAPPGRSSRPACTRCWRACTRAAACVRPTSSTTAWRACCRRPACTARRGRRAARRRDRARQAHLRRRRLRLRRRHRLRGRAARPALLGARHVDYIVPEPLRYTATG